MLVLFKPYPQSIVKTYMASRVHKAKPIEDGDDRKFYFDEALDAEKLDYDSLYSQYKEAYGGLDFLEDDKLWEIMEDEIFWTSRYNSLDRFQLIFTVLSQIERTGTKAYLAQQSPEAKEMKDRIRRVTGEFRRAKQFLTFVTDEKNKAVIGRASFEHKIVDLVLRHFGKRHPGYSVVVLDNEHAHICYKDEILVDSRKKFPDKLGRRDTSRYWTLLSDLKHLESKRDKDYSLPALPKNYYKWVADGAQVYGTIPKVTLDSYVG